MTNDNHDAKNVPNHPLGDWEIPEAATGVRRRTIVTGAAWSIPVIALAVGAPLAAASPGAPTLTFLNGPYTANVCGTVNTPVVHLTTDGTTSAGPGQPVTVTLPAGLTWSDGTTAPKTLITNANGNITIPMTAQAGNGTFSITVTSGAATAAAPVVVSGAVFGLYVNQALVEPDAIKVSEGINGYVFEKADGSVWQRTTNSAAAVQIAPAGTNPTQIMASTWNPGGENAAYFIKPDGQLYWDNGPTEGATVTQVFPGTNGYIFVKSDGSVWERTTSSTSATQIAPAGTSPTDVIGSTWGPANQAVFIRNGTIFYANTGGIQQAESGAVMLASGPNGYTFTKTDGSVWERTNNSQSATQVAPAGTNPTLLISATWVPDTSNIAVYVRNGTIFYNAQSTGESNVIGISAGINGYVFEKSDGSVWQHTNNVNPAVQLSPAGTFPSSFIASTWNANGVNVAYYIAGTVC